MRRLRVMLGWVVVLIGLTARPAPASGFSLEVGESFSRHAEVTVTRVAYQHDWRRTFALGGGWRLAGYWDASAAVWANRSVDRSASQLEDFGITPVFRAEHALASGPVTYFEVAAGAFVLSDDHVSPERRFGGRFSFGDHGAIGVRGARWDVQVRFQHFSNADLWQPNDGINFATIRFGYRFPGRGVK